MNRGRIIVIEGADASGKTSLGDRIHRVLGSAHRIHLRVHKRLPTWQYSAIRRAARFSCKGDHTILDRHFISEQIYAAVFRGGVTEEMDSFNRDQHKLLERAGAVYVLCTSKDTDASYNRYIEHAKKRSEWFGEDPRMWFVIKRYEQLWYGAHRDDIISPTMKAKGFHSFIDELTMHGGVKHNSMWVKNIHGSTSTMKDILYASNHASKLTHNI